MRIMSSRFSPAASDEPVEPQTLLQDPGEQGLKIIEAIGSGKGSFASQIYSRIKMSGKTFEKTVRKLGDAGLIGKKKAKTGRNVLHFYFLTDSGEQLFNKHFTRKHKEADSRKLADVISALEESGWVFNKEEKKLIFKESNKKLVVTIVTTPDKDKILKDLAETQYFICATEGVRNSLLQEAAKLSYQKGPLTLFVTSPEKFGTKGHFEKLEFA